MLLAEKIRRMRERAGLTQEQLAEKLGVSRQVVTKWENGSGMPKIENLKALADYFHVTVDELIGRTDAAEDDPEGQYAGIISELRQCSEHAVNLVDAAIRAGARLQRDSRRT